MRLVFGFVLLMVCAVALPAAVAPAPSGWEVNPIPTGCLAVGPTGTGHSRMAVSAEDQRLRVMVAATGLPADWTQLPIDIAIDGGQAERFDGSASGGAAGVLPNAEQRARLAAAHALVFTVGGKSYAFSGVDVGAAIAAAFTCAGATPPAAPESGLSLASAPDWRFKQQDGNCIGYGPLGSGDGKLGVAARGQRLLVMVAAPGLPRTETEVDVSVSADGGPAALMHGQASNGTVGLTPTPEEARRLAGVNTVAVNVLGFNFVFEHPHLREAIDQVVACAAPAAPAPPSVDAMAESGATSAAAPRPPPSGAPVHEVPGAPGWAFLDLSGSSRQCIAWRRGADVDTFLARDSTGMMIVGLGRWNRNHVDGQTTVTLQIDDNPAQVLRGDYIEGPPNRAGPDFAEPLIMAKVGDMELQQELLGATRLTWTAEGEVWRADAANLRAAWAAIKASC